MEAQHEEGNVLLIRKIPDYLDFEVKLPSPFKVLVLIHKEMLFPLGLNPNSIKKLKCILFPLLRLFRADSMALPLLLIVRALRKQGCLGVGTIWESGTLHAGQDPPCGMQSPSVLGRMS